MAPMGLHGTPDAEPCNSYAVNSPLTLLRGLCVASVSFPEKRNPIVKRPMENKDPKALCRSAVLEDHDFFMNVTG